MKERALFLALMGPPGVGKGAQAERLAETLWLPRVSTGDLCREEVRAGTDLGKRIDFYMQQGKLVSDELCLGLLRQRLAEPDCQRGAILDGFPRTLSQAQALDELLAERGEKLAALIYLTAPKETLVERISGRLICSNGEATYHALFAPPKRPGICDVCGGKLVRRPDDEPETVRHRIEVYLETTRPLVEHYRSRGLLVEVDGEGTPEGVFRSIMEALARGTPRRGTPASSGACWGPQGSQGLRGDPGVGVMA